MGKRFIIRREEWYPVLEIEESKEAEAIEIPDDLLEAYREALGAWESVQTHLRLYEECGASGTGDSFAQAYKKLKESLNKSRTREGPECNDRTPS